MKLLKKLRKEDKIVLKAHGSSMQPIILSGDVVYLKKTSFHKLVVNDIVLVSKNSRYKIHRIVYKTEKYLVTQGDNATQADGKIFPRNIYGRVYAIKRGNIVVEPDNFYLMQSTIYLKEVLKILQDFEREKVKYVILKGLPLTLYCFRKHPSRIYADCDILTSRDHLANVERLLNVNGFRKYETSFTNIHKFLKDKITEISFYKVIQNIPVVIDLHLEPSFLMNQVGNLQFLYPQQLIDQMMTNFLENRERVLVMRQWIYFLSPPDLIMYLLLHFFHHNFTGIYRLEFIDKVIRVFSKKERIFCDVIDRINQHKVGNFVYPVFLLLKKYYGTPFPMQFFPKVELRNKGIRSTLNRLNSQNVFTNAGRLESGVTRFLTIFNLSPEPSYKKLRVFLNPQVIFSIFWVLYKKTSIVFLRNIKLIYLSFL